MDGSVNVILFVFEMLGVVAFALSGVMVAVKKELDCIGVIVVGTVTAVGGGAVRDIILGILPPTMFTQPVYALSAIAVSIISFIIAYANESWFETRIERMNGFINLLDAIGLGIFVTIGVDAALAKGFADNPFLVIFIGTLTGVGGGLMRDQLVGAIPMVLQKRVYAVAAAIGATIYYCMHLLNFLDLVSVACGAGAVVAIRVLAAKYRWNLPRIRLTGVTEEKNRKIGG